MYEWSEYQNEKTTSSLSHEFFFLIHTYVYVHVCVCLSLIYTNTNIHAGTVYRKNRTRKVIQMRNTVYGHISHDLSTFNSVMDFSFFLWIST